MRCRAGSIRARWTPICARCRAISEVHDLHIWGMSTTETALTAHLVREDQASDGMLLHRITHEVRERFGIGHATVQLETPETARGLPLRPDSVV